MHLAAAQQGKIQGRIAHGWIRKGPDPDDRGVRRPANSA